MVVFFNERRPSGKPSAKKTIESQLQATSVWATYASSLHGPSPRDGMCTRSLPVECAEADGKCFSERRRKNKGVSSTGGKNRKRDRTGQTPEQRRNAPADVEIGLMMMWSLR